MVRLTAPALQRASCDLRSLTCAINQAGSVADAAGSSWHAKSICTM